MVRTYKRKDKIIDQRVYFVGSILHPSGRSIRRKFNGLLDALAACRVVDRIAPGSISWIEPDRSSRVGLYGRAARRG